MLVKGIREEFVAAAKLIDVRAVPMPAEEVERDVVICLIGQEFLNPLATLGGRAPGAVRGRTAKDVAVVAKNS
jgi:hypothetical protein